jgi:hypothetical protein
MRPKLARLPILLAAVGVLISAAAAAEPPVDAAPSPTAKADALLRQAVRNIEAHQSISAKLRHETDLFDKHLVGSGTYREVRSDEVRKMRLELRTQLGEQTSSLVQVCDGKYLWIHSNLPSEAKLGRVDVAKATQAIQKAGGDGLAARPAALPSLGGLARLVRGIDAAFEFTAVESGEWGKEKQPVWRLQGQWKQGQLVRLLPNQKETIESGGSPELSKLPEHLPDQVVLLLQQEDLFPCRLEYRRTLPEKLISPGGPASRALVTMDLFEIHVDGRIDPSYFNYSPGDMESSDQTAAFLRSLGVKP